jgi:uncharacterized protein YbaP (TraB family)
MGREVRALIRGGLASRLIATLLLCLVCAGARADDTHHTFWIVKGAHNTVYLLGSVHVLKPADSDLPAEALRAYTSAKALVMEILGLDPEFFSAYQPWFAAMALQQAELAKEGFDAGSGVDEQFAQRAATDHKPIIGLETVDQQLGIFANLSNAQQRRFLLYSLDDAEDTEHAADAVVSAWRVGDVKKLERLLSESFEQYPELFRMLTTDRNRQWLPTITQLLHEDQDYMVIVGALHLVGKDGVVQLLQQAGYQPVQH